MSLPLLKDFDLLQNRWKALLDPIVANSIIQGNQINSIMLNVGVPKTIATGLNRTQLGWIITDQLSNANVWRTQPFNSNNITLQASADTTISIWVF
jgi:hypothetical protein